MSDPIEVKLKSANQKAIAALQDSIVESLLDVDPKIIMHGGTAIWRCYGGNRFSEGVDVYATDLQVKKLKHQITWVLSKRNVWMDRMGVTDRVFYFTGSSAEAKLEAMKPAKGIEPIQKEYERVDGSKFFITTLSINSFISEKIDTYKKRRFVRDFYDIYHLTSIGDLQTRTKKELDRFLQQVERPIDETKLGDLIYAGTAPSFETMVNSIRSRLQ